MEEEFMICHSYTVKHLVSQNSYQRTLHFHDANEIIFSLNDGCSFFLDGQIYDIRRGVLILIPEGVIHRKLNPADIAVDTYTLYYSSALLDAYSTPHTNLTSTFGTAAACIQLPEEAIASTTAMFEKCLPVPGDTFGADLSHNLYFLNMLLSFFPFLSAGLDQTAPRSMLNPLLSSLIDYINEHLTEHLSLDRLAGEFFVSKYNLCRQFKKETGFTIVEYINSSRIRLACSILREEKQVSNIGSRVGFPNTSHFIQTFRQYAGTTPSSYINRYKTYKSVPLFSHFSPPE
jgi:AraC-like DNA-binding protein